ncbi:MAG: NusG domain II-containing protein [Tepidanaerobacter acetatoxydans]|uniref:NusG domain II-containing protein n=1 Tax=Tepidanaerobacter acetatoxydans TaxID=499229 RepID=UPI0026EE3D90|nr:NusG domain II-containing protein [Tepidanaerobacter acetatoxydans]NLU10015.1 NusG domain II-containing protein [Tepidanaerobacter acetatoxydans]
MITKGDKLLIIFVLLLAFILFIGFQIYGLTNDKTYALIEIDGKVYQKISLGENGPKLKLTIPLAHGKSIVEINQNKVRMQYADCPDRDCVRQGWISRPGQMIVCLPNKLVIKIESSKPTKDEVDAVSF